MTNEEIVEEIYWSAHNSGLFDEFSSKVNNRLKSLDMSKNIERINVVEEVYYEFVKSGLIKQGQLTL